MLFGFTYDYERTSEDQACLLREATWSMKYCHVVRLLPALTGTKVKENL